MAQSTITTFDNTAEGWERSRYAFLAEKERRSGSRRTVEGYSRMLQHFFASVGKPPDRVTSPEVFAWGYGVGLSGKQPSSVTIGARLACLSSFYRFLIGMDIAASNPCDALERPRLQVAPPRGLSADDIRRLLAVIPETPVGLRDHTDLDFPARWRAQNLVPESIANLSLRRRVEDGVEPNPNPAHRAAANATTRAPRRGTSAASSAGSSARISRSRFPRYTRRLPRASR